MVREIETTDGGFTWFVPCNDSWSRGVCLVEIGPDPNKNSVFVVGYKKNPDDLVRLDINGAAFGFDLQRRGGTPSVRFGGDMYRGDWDPARDTLHYVATRLFAELRLDTDDGFNGTPLGDFCAREVTSGDLQRKDLPLNLLMYYGDAFSYIQKRVKDLGLRLTRK